MQITRLCIGQGRIRHGAANRAERRFAIVAGSHVRVAAGFPPRWESVFQALVAALTLAMVFVIQHTQARQQAATQRKLDEILQALPGADNALVALENASDEEMCTAVTLDDPCDGDRRPGQRVPSSLPVASSRPPLREQATSLFLPGLAAGRAPAMD